MKKIAPLPGCSPRPPLDRVYLALACMARDEGPYLREWLEYHFLIGVQRIYVYDNGSADDTPDVLAPYIADGRVIYTAAPGQLMMFPCYADALYHGREEARWLGFIDVDEFVVPHECDDLRDFLRDYEAYPAVGINWVVFDSSGHEHRPQTYGALVTANYTHARRDYQYNGTQSYLTIKSFVNPMEVLGMPSAHFGAYRDGRRAVSETFEEISGVFSRVNSCRRAQINHYYTKSADEYRQRLARGRSDTRRKKEFSAADLNFASWKEDLKIARFLPALKAAMGIAD